jgi:hypothetical protein
MNTISIWLVGSYVVPLAVLFVFAIFYFVRYKQYLLHKNSYKDCQFLEDCWKGYIFARLWQEECRTGFKPWWYLLGSKYIDLVNFYSERCVYELDQLDRFDEPNDNRPCFNRKAFMRHWREIHSVLFDNGHYADEFSSKSSPYKFNPKFGDDPFGWMTVMIESKMFELYKKHALLLLRTKGFQKFSEFLASSHDKSQRYPHNAAFSIIASGKFHEKIASDHAVEIGERIHHEVKIILGTDKIPTSESQAKKLEALVENFFLKGNIAVGGGYDGAYRVGLSEARSEIFDLLEKTKMLN